MQKGIDYVGVTVSYICHDGKGNFVFSKRGQNARDERGTWDFGGGGLDFGDTVEQTLLKELKEEYCVEPISYEFLGYTDLFREHEGKKTHWLALNFLVLVDPTARQILKNFRAPSRPTSPLHIFRVPPLSLTAI